MTGFDSNPHARLSPALLRALALLMLEITDESPTADLRAGAGPRASDPFLSSAGIDVGASHHHAGGVGDEVEFILADARARARDIIEESMRRARALLSERPTRASRAPEAESLHEIHLAVTDLAAEVRVLQQRFDRLEALLPRDTLPGVVPGGEFRPPDRPGGRVAPRSVAPSAAAASAAPTVPGSLTATAWNTPPPEPMPSSTMPAWPAALRAAPLEVPAAPEAATVPPFPAPAPAAVLAPPDGVPTFLTPADTPSEAPTVLPVWDDTAAGSPGARIEASTAGDHGATGASIGAAAESASLPASARSPESPASPTAVGVTFEPSTGLVSVRISPVAGFQGLMRMQEALLHVPGIREAGVDAYARGEAALRLQLATGVNVHTMAAGLAARLGQVVRVESVSESDRLVRLVIS